MKKRLYRLSRGKVIAGVCAGLGEYFEIDPVFIRALFVIALFSGGIGAMFYVVLWMIMPSEKALLSSNPSSDTSELSETDESAFSEKHKGTVVTGLVLIALGTFFLIREFFPMFSFKFVLPIALIAIGAVIVFNALRKNLTSSNS
jgi:phage shock protein C